jgi:hypothetical protein
MSGDIQSYGNLEQRIHQYYRLEQNNEWGNAYYFRTLAFRKAVSIERYISSMQKNNSGWRLDRYDIRNVWEKEGKVYVRIQFFESAPMSFFSGTAKNIVDKKNLESAQIEVEEDTVWIKTDGQWFTYYPGTRSHLLLNEALVSE